MEADIVSLEAQSFGVAVGFGGPYCGVIACKEKFLRQMPGRLVGETKDTNGKRGCVLTLSTREQHIRREKATSNICTNQALVAMMVTIFLTVYGKQGLRELAEQNLAKAAYLRKALLDAGAATKFDGAPRFHEFVLTTKESADGGECEAAGEADCWRAGAGEVVSGAGRECDAVVRDGADDQGADGCCGEGAGGRAGSGACRSEIGKKAGTILDEFFCEGRDHRGVCRPGSDVRDY